MTDDEVEADEAFELWKIRELTRVKRDREEREKLVRAARVQPPLPHCCNRLCLIALQIRDKAEIDRRRLMTDSDVLAGARTCARACSRVR